jgi:uncharacterized Fe-S center protein
MRSKVYFAGARAQSRETSLVNKIGKLFKEAGFDKIMKGDDLVAIKLHFGERGNTRFIRPIYVRQIVEQVKRIKAKPFLTDANTLYRGKRKNAVDHLNTAISNGFSYATIGAPIIIADGLKGKSFSEVRIDKKHIKSAKISNEIYYADALIVVTHFKGHGGTGMAGSMKNIGMGAASPAGKQIMHANVLPSVNQSVCIGCARCKKWCPAEAITIENKKSFIHSEICIGCMECVTVCPTGAISIMWNESTRNLQEKMVEYVYAVLENKQDKAGFFSFIMDVTPDCDCTPWSDVSVVPDIGILASRDPVAIEQASLDLVNAQEGLKDRIKNNKMVNGEW